MEDEKMVVEELCPVCFTNTWVLTNDRKLVCCGYCGCIKDGQEESDQFVEKYVKEEVENMTNFKTEVGSSSDNVDNTMKSIVDDLQNESRECRPKQKERKQNHIDFKEITFEMRTLYQDKNSRYGNSFDQSLDEDGLLVSKIRLNDKLKRFGNLIKNIEDLGEGDESMRDTLLDLANYAVMTVMWMDREEEKKRSF